MGNKIALVYKSKYGNTKKYVNWLKENIECDVYERDKVKIKQLLKYDTIIYGAGIYMGKLNGFNLIKNNINKLLKKKIIVFAVGCSLESQKNLDKIKKSNLIGLDEKVKLFYFRGGLDFKNLKFCDKMALKFFRNTLANKKEPLGKEERLILTYYEKAHDWTNEESLKPLIKYVNEK